MKSFIVKSLIVALALALGPITTSYAQNAGPSSIQVLSPWARATPGGAKNGAVYMTIVNQGKTADRLVAVTTPVATTAGVHRTENKNGVMEMQPVPSVDVKAGSQAIFRPGGYHVMLRGLQAPLADGQSFPMTLTFEQAGALEVTVKIQKTAPMGHDHMGGMKME